MRRQALVLLAAILLAGCATTSGAARSASAGETNQPPRRCSPADPDRWAWFCVVGQILYGAAAFFTPVNETATR